MNGGVKMTEADKIEIERLRKEIDKCDDEIFKALRIRCSLSYLIGLRKKNSNIPIVDNDRFTKMVEDKVKTFSGYHLHESFIRKIYNVIHKEFCKLQK